MSADGDRRIVIVVPVYDDWEAFGCLLRGLESVLRDAGLRAEVLAVDDGSPTPLDADSVAGCPFSAISAVSVLRLGRNLGHQRAIAIALAHLSRERTFDVAVVMDADGQDRPEDVPRLLAAQAASPGLMVFAHRARRSEGWVFALSYGCFKALFRLLTGKRMSFGNFSAIPAPLVRRLVLVSELWNHYPASVVKARLPFETISTHRAARSRGRSSMNYTALLAHGLSALSVHGDVVGIRALIATSALIAASAAMLSAVVAIRLVTDWAIPGWASHLSASFFIVLLQAVMLSVFFVMILLNGRRLTDVILSRDYAYFVLGEEKIFPGDRHAAVRGVGAGAVQARP